SQIVCLQALWYISISTIVFTLFKFSGLDINLDAILNYREIRGDNSQGLLLGLAWLLNSVVGVYLLLKIVARARLVLDFSLTLLLYHVIMTTLYSDHVPTSFLWWSLNGTTAGIMVFGGEYVCMQQEMEPILLGGGNNSGSSDNRNASRGDSRVDSIGVNKNNST
ncbi:integral membrane protein S linking to the trans Golgi network-domain-containing protein, partial [Dissophora ornata]